MSFLKRGGFLLSNLLDGKENLTFMTFQALPTLFKLTRIAYSQLVPQGTLIAARGEVHNIAEIVSMKPNGDLHLLPRLLLALTVSVVSIVPSFSQTGLTSRSTQARGTRPFSASANRLSMPPAQAAVSDSAQAEWVRYFSSGSLKGHAEGMAVTTDAQGNIYVTGNTEDAFSSYDYLTVKYDAMGVEQWSATYDGPAHGVDIAEAVAVDSTGNVYITGTSAGIESGYDFATVKYNASGQQRWVARYDGSGHAGDAGSSIAADGEGNVYVGGESAEVKSLVSNDFDIATIKYNSLGAEQWVNRYDGRAHWDDKLIGLALDRCGDIVVVGKSCDSLDGDSTAYSTELNGCIILKYAPAGDQRWAVDYRPADTISAYPLAFSVTDSGDVVVTGYVKNGTRWRWSPMPTKSLTAKFNAQGVLQWSSLYHNPQNQYARGTHIAMDHWGNSYIAGVLGLRYSPGVDSLFISKYDWNGQFQWASIVDRQEWGYLSIVGVASDPAGGVVLSSRASFYNPNLLGALLTIKYSPAGVEERRTRYDDPHLHNLTAPALTSDISGNLLIVGSSGGDQGSDLTLLKYTASGSQNWVRSKECTRSWDQVYATTVDDSNNVYVTGTSSMGGSASDIQTIKYTPTGVFQWVARYHGVPYLCMVPCAVKVDHEGNVYVLATGDSTDYYDPLFSLCITLKYNVSGQQQWAALYHGESRYESLFAVDLNLDRNGNAIVTGNGYDFYFPSQAQYVTFKYDHSGARLWAARHDTTGPAGATAVAVDDSNNTLVAGGFRIVKYDDAGNTRWAYPSFWSPFVAVALAVDHSGNVYFTQEGGTTTKLSSSGTQLWTVNFGGNAIALDAAANVLVRNAEGGIARFRSSGAQLWSLPIDDCIGSSLAVDSVGNTFISGTRSDGSSAEYQVRAFSPSGVQLWSTGFEDNGTSSWYQYPIAVSHGRDVFVGAGAQCGSSTIFKTIKYRQVATAVKDGENGTPTVFALEQNYPNPFNPTTTIRFSIPHVGTLHATSLRVYDLLGREVATLVNDQLSPGSYTTQWNAANVASGVYFYCLQSGGNALTKKLVIMK